MAKRKMSVYEAPSACEAEDHLGHIACAPTWKGLAGEIPGAVYLGSRYTDLSGWRQWVALPVGMKKPYRAMEFVGVEYIDLG